MTGNMQSVSDTRRRRRPPAFALVFFSLLSIFFLSVGYKTVLYPLYMAHRAQSWPTVDGEVTQSNLTYKWSKRGCSYNLDFRYRYAVSGQAYTGDNYIYGGGLCFRDTIREVVANHPAGQHIPVHYASDNPVESVIVAGTISGNNQLGLIIFPILTFLPIALLIGVYLRMNKKAMPRTDVIIQIQENG